MTVVLIGVFVVIGLFYIGLISYGKPRLIQ